MSKSISNTSITFGQITAPVKIYSASSSSDVTLKFCGPNGEDVQQVYRIKESGEVLGTKTACSRSFDGKLVEDADVKAAEAASLIEEVDGTPVNLKETIKIQKFVPLSKIPFERVTGSYYIGADTKRGGVEAVALIQKALAKKKVAAIAKFILRGRQKQFAIYSDGEILHAVAITFADDKNEAGEDVTLQSKVAVDKSLVDLAVKLIDADLDKDGTIVDELSDTLVERKRELFGAGEPIKVKQPDNKTAGESLADALAASLEKKKEVPA
jgi:non-homologous end joining protein Ku